MGPNYSAFAEALIEREVSLDGLMTIEAKRLPALEQQKMRFQRDTAILTVSEFGLLSLGLNAILFSGSIPAVATALDQLGFGVSTNKGLLLRQLVNGIVGGIAMDWAATYRSDYGPINSGLPAKLSELQAVIDTDNVDGGINADRDNPLKRDKDYGLARAHLEKMIRIYSDADNNISHEEVGQYDQNIETYGVTTFAAKHPLGSLFPCRPFSGIDTSCALISSIPDKNGWRLDWHVAKQAFDWWKGKKETVNIEETAIQAHVNLYLDEIKFLQGEIGRLFARCEERLAKVDAENPGISESAISDVAIKIGLSLQTQPGSQAGRTPVSAGTPK